MVRLLPLRHRRRAGLQPALLPDARSAGRHAQRLRHVRRGVRGPPARRRGLRPLRRPGRPQDDAGVVAPDHGRRDGPDRPDCRRTARSASGRRSCWWCCGSSRASASAASGAARCCWRSSIPVAKRAAFTGPGRRWACPADCCSRPACSRRSRRGSPRPQFLAWGWRVPFLSRVVLIGVGLFIRLRVLETPSFEQAQGARAASRASPLLEVFREHPREVLVGMGMRFAQNVIFYIYTVFVLSYGEKTLGYPRGVMLRGVDARVVDRPDHDSVLVASLGPHRAAAGLPGGRDHLAARRVPVLLAARAGPAFVGDRDGAGDEHRARHDVRPDGGDFSELFGTRVRYTGASLVYQLTSVVPAAWRRSSRRCCWRGMGQRRWRPTWSRAARSQSWRRCFCRRRIEYN